MDRTDKINKNKRRSKTAKKFVTHQQLDQILDRRIEDKFLDVNREAVPVLPLSAVINERVLELSVTPEGDTASSRIGLRTKPKSLAMRFLYTANDVVPTIPNSAHSIRTMVIQWHLDAADPPVVADILNLDIPLLTGEGQTLAYYNLGNINKFSVVYNKIIHLNRDDDAGTWLNQDEFYKSFPKNQKNCLFEAGTNGDPTTGTFYLLMFSTALAGEDNPFVSWVSRFRYEDA